MKGKHNKKACNALEHLLDILHLIKNARYNGQERLTGFSRVKFSNENIGVFFKTVT
jgi:hypothetical protein